MSQATRLIAVILLSGLAGCRVAGPIIWANPTGGGADALRLSVPEAEQPEVRLGAEVPRRETQQVSSEIEFPEPSSEQLPAPAGSAGPMSLADLEGIALEHNPALAAAFARLGAARGRRLQAGLYPNPVIGYHATEIGNEGQSGQQGAFISQQLITAGKLHLDQAIAGKEIDEAQFRLHAQERRVLSDVRLRFYEALVAQRRLELTAELAGIGADVVRSTEKLLASRLSTENRVSQAQIKADEAEILVDNARNQHVEAWRRLAAVIGLPTLEVTPLSGELDDHLPAISWDEASAVVLVCNPELNAAWRRVERAGIAIQRAQREPIPNIELSVSQRHHHVTQDDVTNVQVGIPIPVFDRNQGRLVSAEAEWTEAYSEAERISLELQDRLAVAYRRYANAHQQVDRYSRRMLPNARELLERERAGYEQGQVQYLTLLTAQQTYVQMNLAYLDSLRELWAATVLIEGQLLTGSLGGDASSGPGRTLGF